MIVRAAGASVARTITVQPLRITPLDEIDDIEVAKALVDRLGLDIIDLVERRTRTG